MINLSIIITYRDDPLRLRLALSGYRYQSTHDFELIVVNDGGEPFDSSSLELPCNLVDINYYATADDFRLAAARNLGATYAQGKRLAFTDQDCIPMADFAYRHGSAIDCLIGARSRINRHLAERLTFDDLLHLEYLPTKTDERLNLNLNSPLALAKNCFGCNFSLPTALFSEIGGFDVEYVGWGYEDIDLACRALQAKAQFTFDHSVMVYHLDHKQSPRSAPNERRFRRLRCG